MVAQSQVGTCLPALWMEGKTRGVCLEVSADAPSDSLACNQTLLRCVVLLALA